MKNVPTPDAVSDTTRTETPEAKPEPRTDRARAVDAWRQVLRRRGEHLAGRWTVPVGSAAYVVGQEIFHWVARICAAAEDVLREVQASRQAPPADNEPGDDTQNGRSEGPAAQAANGPAAPTAGAGYDPVRMLETLFAQPVRDLLQHLLPTVEYQEVVEPVVAEIHRVYTRILFRPPTADEIGRHVGAFYERFATLSDRCQAVREGNLRPHLGIRPLMLETDVTNQCNLRCIMCHFSDPAYSTRKREDMSVENFTRIASKPSRSAAPST